jgi:hypothetical protein
MWVQHQPDSILSSAKKKCSSNTLHLAGLRHLADPRMRRVRNELHSYFARELVSKPAETCALFLSSFFQQSNAPPMLRRRS